MTNVIISIIVMMLMMMTFSTHRYQVMFVRVLLNSILVMKSYNIQKFACHAPDYGISSGLLALCQHVMA